MSLPHHKLVAWQRADDLFVELHRLTYQRFPRAEQYELGSQLRRAAFSVAANIVEGTARPTAPDALKFLRISSSSLAEVGYALHAANRLGYLNAELLHEFETKVRMVAAPLHGLIRRYRTGRLLDCLLVLAIAGNASQFLQ